MIAHPDCILQIQALTVLVHGQECRPKTTPPPSSTQHICQDLSLTPHTSTRWDPVAKQMEVAGVALPSCTVFMCAGTDAAHRIDCPWSYIAPAAIHQTGCWRTLCHMATEVCPTFAMAGNDCACRCCRLGTPPQASSAARCTAPRPCRSSDRPPSPLPWAWYIGRFSGSLINAVHTQPGCAKHCEASPLTSFHMLKPEV
jgi:hypothetical protein